MDKKVKVYIEIEKDSNVKYELNKETNTLEVDRILPYPYYYPYSYGFITNTLAMDNDELDALIITDKKIERDRFYDVYIVGVLIMSDEKGLDEKVLCVLEEDYYKIKDLEDFPMFIGSFQIIRVKLQVNGQRWINLVIKNLRLHFTKDHVFYMVSAR